MTLLAIGVVMFASGLALDLLFRLDLRKTGEHSQWKMGGAFSYGRYHQIAERNGWGHWPVYCMWALYIFGIALAVVYLLIQAGAFRGL